MSKQLHKTDLGEYRLGDSVKALNSSLGKKLRGKVQLILTSPPFPLNRKKSYGNFTGEEYKEWLIGLAPLFSELLTDDGSIVIEMGNSWVPGRPVQSLLHLESLIGFVNAPNADLRLCQQFVCFNPSRLPSPAEWVTVRRMRVTDSYTQLWWMSKTDYPKADNRRVLRPYSESMKSLIKKKKYNSGKRPSEHGISENGFLTDHGGSIALNLIELEQMDEGREVRLPQNAFSAPHTTSNDYFFRKCREEGIVPHPARMPTSLAAFFIEFLTDPDDMILDPFAGSNTTGFAAELRGRRWTSVEIKEDYAKQARIRLKDPVLKKPRAAQPEEV